MTIMYHFAVMEQKFPKAQKPYRIIEFYPTCDGTRSRLTDRFFTYLNEAQTEAMRLEEMVRAKP